MCHEEKQVSGVGFQVVLGIRVRHVSGPLGRAGSTALEIGSENPRAKARATLANFFPGLPFLRQGKKARASTLKPESGPDKRPRCRAEARLYV
jgi:hypothetical protein